MPSHFCKIVVGKTKTFSSFQFHSLANKAEQVHGGGSCRWDNHNTAAHSDDAHGGLNGDGLNLQRRFLLRPKPPEVLQQRGGEGGCPAKPHQHPGFVCKSSFIIVYHRDQQGRHNHNHLILDPQRKHRFKPTVCAYEGKQGNINVDALWRSQSSARSSS